jgi:hypothetical protein
VTGCTTRNERLQWVDIAAVCADVKDQSFHPALGNEGTPQSGTFVANLSPRQIDVEQGDAPRPLFATDRPPPPSVLVIAPSADYVRRFPPENDWVSYLYRPPEWKSEPKPGLRDRSLVGGETGLVVYTGGSRSAPTGQLKCNVVQSSRDREQDDAACRFAIEELAPQWSDASDRKERAVPLYVGRDGESFSAVGPATDWVKRPYISTEDDQALVSALTGAGLLPDGREASDLQLRLNAGMGGKVTHCRIVRTTGTDAGDAEACKIAKATVRVRLRENVFGTPDATGRVDWDANPDTE